MLRRIDRLILCMIMAMVLAACSTKALTGDADGSAVAIEKSRTVFDTRPFDQQMFDEAISYLSNEKKEPNYKEAKIRLENLLEKYPKSKWLPAARAILFCMERISVLQSQIKQEKQKEHVKLTKEIEGIKESARQNEEKNSIEIIRLQQENEQLKRDIQQLKNLEIQLERREKMLR